MAIFNMPCMPKADMIAWADHAHIVERLSQHVQGISVVHSIGGWLHNLFLVNLTELKKYMAFGACKTPIRG